MKQLRYLLEAILAFTLYIVLRMMPVRLASFLCGKLACMIGPYFKAHQTAKKNLAMAFPEKTQKEREFILRRMWENLGRTVGEFSYVGRCSHADYHRMVTVEGEAYLKQYLQQGKPAIFFSAHMANWELAPKTAAVYGAPLALVYRPSNNPLVEKLIMHVRQRYQVKSIAKGVSGAREVITCLKQGQPLGMLLDQKMNDGIAVPFFGHNAMTAPAVAHLAKKFGCPLIPAHIIREGSMKFKVIISAPIYAKNTGNSSEDTLHFMTQINHIIEGWVRERPEQWFWVHNRWPKE